MSEALSALRNATRDIHDEFEQGLKLARPDAGQAEYLNFISAMWGWLKPFEQALWREDWPADIDAAQRARKSDWLRRDLLAAGMDEQAIAALPLLQESPPLDTPAQRYGVAYVLEGAQLGSQLLSRTLGPRLAPWPAHWLAGYGDKASQRWLSFRKLAERDLAGPTEREEAAQAARWAFRTLSSWFRERGAA
ncbi:biliverdin-producing heme oxygenase [Noviherbaspirillum pedocola]|uniref:Biliverdin-producing heme oxygenase n=1 Tax=Noviherbaspirillum pedocola TaxID=2801341 RepID=A0A934STD8_9BURK|nr:biliverdin-producing heme oxygenase [Noviherbaspirillum pedocola]MBK4736260.1 biliverdin-producing heme oxygenase [Noviherbaspirillum pedocola]